MDLDLFDWSIGISDVLQWRDCPARFAYGMRRHVTLPPHIQVAPDEKDEPPESRNWTNVRGSAIHHAIHLVDKEGLSHDAAIEAAMSEYGAWLTIEDAALMREDLAIFERRRLLGVQLIASEADMRVPLFMYGDRQVFFRFKIDALYRLIAAPDVFVSVDYKSSKHRKTPAEVHSDLQQWLYNFGVHEYYPECRHLIQRYDQLRFGVEQTSKSPEQRAEAKDWLISQVKAIIADQTYAPKRNEWCRWCPMVTTCRETYRATKAARAELAISAPLTREGRKVKAVFIEDLEEFERLISDELPKLIEVRKHIEVVEKELKRVLEDMPIEERERLGWAVRERRSKELSADGLRALYEMMGEEFWQIITLSMTRFEEIVPKPGKGDPVPPQLQLIRDHQTETVSGSLVVPAKSSN
jgi:hypothetical protein